MDDFSSPGSPNAFGFLPSSSNFIYPGKRPMSSMSPIIFFNSTNGEVVMVLGGAGGSRIISSTAYVALRALMLGENVKEAVDAPRLHHQLYPPVLNLEEEPNAFPEELGVELAKLGHGIKRGPSGAVCAILRRDALVQANTDFRKGSGAGVAGF